MLTPFSKLLIVSLLPISLIECQEQSDISHMGLISAEQEDSGSIELPVRKQRSEYLPPHQPIVEFILGVLDTFHLSSKSELKRIKARRARHNNEAHLEEAATTESPVSKIYASKIQATPRKRMIAPIYG